MKIQLLSDLHLESNPDFVPEPAPDADVLVLAGDIGSYQGGSALTGQGDSDFGLGRFSPLRGWPVPVLFVPGNHEYDALDFDQAHARLRETCERLGITWLERDSVLLQGVRFVGTTLWSDFDALGPLAGQALPDAPAQHAIPAGLTAQLKAREKAFRAANWYLRKTGTTRCGEPWLAAQVREREMQDLSRQLRRLQRMSENLGMVSLGLVAGDVRTCLERSDVTAFSAVWARLVRVAERSLAPDKALLDQTFS